MATIVGPLKSSANAGELSDDLKHKVGLKQFYSGGLKMKNLEPVPQSGFRLLPGTARVGSLPSTNLRVFVLRVRAGLSYTLFFTEKQVKIYNDDRTHVFTLALNWLEAGMLAGLQFYGEANTVGVFHQNRKSRLIFRNNNTDWDQDYWPYKDIPDVNLKGNYTQTADEWDIYIRYIQDTQRLSLSLSIDGNETSSVDLLHNGNTVTPLGQPDSDWVNMGNQMQDALRALPGMNNDLTVTFKAGETMDYFRVYTVKFTNSLKGREYQFDAKVISSSDASALVAHVKIGSTAGEPLINGTGYPSDGNGWFAGMELFQDRACYFAPRARKSAIAMSQTGEYFNLNITNQADNGARLEALRTETSEEILHMMESSYLVIFTDQSEWFATSRVVSRNEPINFKQVSRNGTKRGARPVEMETRIWYVSRDGDMLFSMAYDDVSTSYNARPESLLSTHLVKKIKRLALQRKTGDNNANRLWMVRDDGRLICAIVIEAQEITAFCEWKVADGGKVVDIAVDGNEDVWLVVERDGAASIEIMEEMEKNLFQRSVSVTTDATGLASGLSGLNGKQVWAEIANNIYGPFDVSGGSVQTDLPNSDAKIGLWIAPLFQSMPYLKTLKNDDVVFRPGRIHSVLAHVIDTQSIAIGANGRPAKNIPLLAHDDDLENPAPYTGKVEVRGLIGVQDGPTVTITQTRPGMLRLQDFTPGVKN